MHRKKQKKRRSASRIGEHYDFQLWAIIIILIALGLIMLYSASSYEAILDQPDGGDMFYFMRQLKNSLVAIAVAIVVSVIDYHRWQKFSFAAYIGSIVLMGLVKFTPLGIEVYGAKRWLRLGPLSFQPSETAKLAMILFVPYLILRYGKNLISKKGRRIVLGLIVFQSFCAYWMTENLSTALIILAIGVAMLGVAYPKKSYVVLLSSLSLGIPVLSVFFARVFKDQLATIDDFRIARVLVWLEPEKYMNKESFQVLQGLYAIGSGGIFGKGLGNSAQKLATIPEAQNDMIFSIICEEFGLFGAVCLLMMFGYLLYRLFWISTHAPDFYGSMIAAGVFVHVAVQVVLNICVVLAVIPTTGVSLPFVSYGGTSVIFLMMEIGLVLSVSGRIRIRDRKSENTGDIEERPARE